MILERVLCPLCANKTFKNSHGLRIHHSTVHISKKISINKVNEYTTCSLCPKKTYKSTQGLRQHETLRYLYYNTPSSNLLELPQQHINEVKETLFVRIFRDFINRYSPSSNRYLCVFQGPDAYETLGKLLNRSNWGTRKYQHGQETRIVLGELFENDSATDSKSSEQIQLQKTKSKCNTRKKDIPQLTIEWKKRTVTDNANNKSFSSELKIDI
ncbi:hypothetical protein C2G38_2178063 [Gigaspora rosea]|uniref:C2H2-type domain-containing protein n=1 Tax=Gigaspora rosea TaxID=44941 RepID=A0A397VNZ4_9GLOM|nr:hypothetical protein C2G38_2178063 [Gigaspora rosea]